MLSTVIKRVKIRRLRWHSLQECVNPKNIQHRLADCRPVSSTSNNSDHSKNSNSSTTTENIAVLMNLRKYIWPENSEKASFYIKTRVFASFTLLIASKSMNIYVPFIFKQLVDYFQDNTGNII